MNGERLGVESCLAVEFRITVLCLLVLQQTRINVFMIDDGHNPKSPLQVASENVS